jgi:hypothetical protein
MCWSRLWSGHKVRLVNTGIGSHTPRFSLDSASVVSHVQLYILESTMHVILIRNRTHVRVVLHFSIQNHFFSPQSRQSAKPFLQSSELGLPQPLTSRRVCPPPWFWGEGHTRWRERGRESPNSDEGTFTVVLFIYTYCEERM